MYSGFLHGIEIIETTVGPLPITVVRSAVIGLVGTAPTWAAPFRPSWYTPPVGAAVPAWCVDGSADRTFPLWNRNAVYEVGDCVVDGAGNIQQVTVAGTSADTPPSWPATLDSTITDNTVTWKLVQLAAQYRQLNIMNLVSGSGSGAGYGPRVRGYTIPYALRKIQLQGAGQVIVVNVFDRNEHAVAVTAEAKTFPATGVQEINLGHMGISNVKVTNAGDTVTYVLGDDFTLDHVNGVITQTSGTTMTANQSVLVTYDYADPADASNGVVNSEIVGLDGPPATGLALLRYAESSFGFKPKILITPGFSYKKLVADQMLAIGEKVRAMSIIDTPGGLAPIGGGSSAAQVSQDAMVQTGSVLDALDARSDTAEAFGTAEQRAVLLWPNAMFLDDGVDPTGADFESLSDGDYSAWWAGACAANDLKFGYWYSPSNIQVRGIVGPDVPFIMSATDPTSDSNTLNGAGIVTMFNGFGTGLRVWGNRDAAYPSSTDPATFISIRRTLDVIEDSLEFFSLQFLDKPISNALITSILQSVNGFIRQLIQRGALVPGSEITYDPDNNPDVQLAAGQIVFDVNLMPPPPAERITYNFHLDITLLQNITGAVA